MRSPKTAGHDGHAVRVVPISPELRDILQTRFDEAEPGSVEIVPRLRDAKMNLRTTLHKIIVRAGYSPWPRLFHNPRASCATDWVERAPAHAVAGWLGHSPMIAARHYLQTRDTHFAMVTGIRKAKEESGAKSGALEAQNAAQHPPAPVRVGSPVNGITPVFKGEKRGGANKHDVVRKKPMGPRGFEPPTSPLSAVRSDQLSYEPSVLSF